MCLPPALLKYFYLIKELLRQNWVSTSADNFYFIKVFLFHLWFTWLKHLYHIKMFLPQKWVPFSPRHFNIINVNFRNMIPRHQSISTSVKCFYLRNVFVQKSVCNSEKKHFKQKNLRWQWAQAQRNSAVKRYANFSQFLIA